MKTYKTNVSCPKCGNGLKTGKIMGYGLMCQKCEEYFKISDLQKENEYLFDEGFEIGAYMNLEKFELLSNKLGTLADKYNCDFFGCDDIFEAADFAWEEENIPDDEAIIKFTSELQEIEGHVVTF